MNFSQTAKSVLAAVAPLIGTALGGPFGGLAGSLLSKALGTSDPKAMEAAITSTDPDILLKLKQADSEFQEHMKQLGIDQDKLAFDDTANARNLEIQSKSWTPSILSYGVLGASTSAFLAIVLGWVRMPSDPTTAAIYGSVLTFLVTESKAVLGYWFGSSSGSQAKDDTIAQIAKQ